jgi:hypothetical protein
VARVREGGRSRRRESERLLERFSRRHREVEDWRRSVEEWRSEEEDLRGLANYANPTRWQERNATTYYLTCTYTVRQLISHILCLININYFFTEKI